MMLLDNLLLNLVERAHNDRLKLKQPVNVWKGDGLFVEDKEVHQPGEDKVADRQPLLFLIELNRMMVIVIDHRRRQTHDH